MVYTITCNDNANTIDTKNKKSIIWKQISLAFIASLPFFTNGMETNVLSSSSHAGHYINTSDDVPWSTTAFLLGAIISAPIYCCVIDRFGRKVGIYMINLTQGASFVPLLFEENETNSILLHILAGTSSAGLFTVLPIYVREISNDVQRSVTMAFMMLLLTAGYMMKLIIDTETMTYVMVGMVAFQFISMCWILETPSLLVKIKKVEMAQTNLSRLRCLDEDDPSVTTEINQLIEESVRAKSKGNLSVISILRNQIWRDAFKIGLALHTTMVLCGSVIFLDESKALLQLRTVINPKQTLVVVCLFIGSFSCFVFVRFVDRKYLLTLGYSAMVVSTGVLAVYTQADLTVATLRWVPVAALIALVISYGFAWGLPVLIIVELLNFEIRATLIGILYTYSQVLKLVHVHTFKYIEDYMGIYTVFYIFATINIFGAVYTLFGVPNIKDRTVRQIERQLKKIPILK